MTGDFLTNGLQEDRYLKALRLVDQFEDEIEARLRDLGERMTNAQPGLFGSGSEPDYNTNQTPANGLAHQRINHEMDGPQSPETRHRLNVHLYWMPPTEFNRTDIDGALRGFGYKIKGADTTVDDHVADQTRNGDWPLQMSDNPWDDNTVFYQHVSTQAEIEVAADTLVDHFTEFGDEYAATPDE